ncbi:PEP-CTERM sorting domain-containing protein [Kiritimatiellota bacterium B12222]|nr:PEP-CTERM sorting domain-containing protein [Kiritimatiellota bacterium B12222]
MITKIHKTFTATVAAIFLSSVSMAAVAPITAATFSGSVAGTVTDPVSFTSITVGGQVYSNLEYGTASYTGTLTNQYYYTAGEDPGTNLAALSNNILTDGILNIPRYLSVNFGRAITSEDLIFVTELASNGAGETLALGLIDSSNERISGTAVLFGDVGAGGPGDLFTMNVLRSSGDNDINGVGVQGSGMFLSDFGSPGSTVPYGIYFSNSSENELDPSVVGLATIPEPSSIALVLVFAGVFVIRARRRRC